ncbi:hypothetical protein DL93DRAFT_215183 [Clavulina sp. PMI_390]|nr:hypothetical protein DL93DRAFT_215183 [Clavulina sp. PMI_390]
MADPVVQTLEAMLGSLKEVLALNFSHSQAAMVPTLRIQPPAARKTAYLDISRRIQQSKSRIVAAVFLRSKVDEFATMLVAEQNALGSLVVPIFALPAEILSEILLIASRSSPGLSSASIAANLSLVCRGWYDVCLTLPHVWDQISIPPQNVPLLNALNNRISRGDIHLTIFPTSRPAEAFSFAHRVSSLIIDGLVEPHTMFAPLFGDTQCSTSLRSLSLFPRAAAPDSNERELRIDLSKYSFPALTKLELSDIPIVGFPGATNLKHLQISSLPRLQQIWWTRVIHCFPQLEHISVHKVDSVGLHRHMFLVLERLAHLRRFEASHVGRPVQVDLLSCIDAPDLTYLSLDDMKYKDTFPDMEAGEDIDDARDDANTRRSPTEPMGRTWQRVFRQIVRICRDILPTVRMKRLLTMMVTVYQIVRSRRLKVIKLRSTAGILRNLLIPLRPFSKMTAPPVLPSRDLEELSILIIPGENPSMSETVATLLSSTLATREKMGNRLSLLEVTSCIADAMSPPVESFASSTRIIPCSCDKHWTPGDRPLNPLRYAVTLTQYVSYSQT